MIKGTQGLAFKEAQELGCTMFRLWDFGNKMEDRLIEPEPHKFHKEHYQKAAKLPNLCRDFGMEPLGVLYATWPHRTPVDSQNLKNPHDNINEWAKLNAWQRYVSAVSWGGDEYKIHFWEVWNEPNHSGFWSPPNPENYVEAVRQAASVLHQRRMFVVAGASVLDVNFIDEIIDLGIGKYIDAFSIHYGYEGRSDYTAFKYIQRIKAIRAKLGGIPIWNTETNAGTINRFKDGEHPMPQDFQRWWQVNEEAGVDAVFYYYMRNIAAAGPENLCNENGVKQYAQMFGTLGSDE